jgi:hypothetical protein
MKAAITLLMMSGCVVVGCGKKEQEEPKPAAAAVVAADSVGVAECDDYLKKIDQCVVTNPAQKAAMEQTKTQMVAMFKSMATAPGGKEKLKADCVDHLKLLPPSCAK